MFSLLIDYNNYLFFVSISFQSLLLVFFQLLLMISYVECSPDLSVQRLHLQIAAELLVFDTAALKSDHFILQKTTMNFFFCCFVSVQSP